MHGSNRPHSNMRGVASGSSALDEQMSGLDPGEDVVSTPIRERGRRNRDLLATSVLRSDSSSGSGSQAGYDQADERC